MRRSEPGLSVAVAIRASRGQMEQHLLIAAANAGERLQFRCAVHVRWPGVAELGSFDNVMTEYPKVIDFAGWALVVLAGLMAVVAIIGALAVLYVNSPWGAARMQQRLHEVYYIVYPSWTAALIFLLCLGFACGIGVLGYSQTKRYVERRTANVEPIGPANGSQPFRSE